MDTAKHQLLYPAEFLSGIRANGRVVLKWIMVGGMVLAVAEVFYLTLGGPPAPHVEYTQIIDISVPYHPPAPLH